MRRLMFCCLCRVLYYMVVLSVIANILWLILCIYFEARGESVEGQIAVGHVCLNRVRSRDASLKSIVQAPWQFSWLNPGVKRPAVDDFSAFEQCIKSALKCFSERLEGKDLFGADHYHADYIKTPSWAHKITLVKHVDSHLFYRS